MIELCLYETFGNVFHSALCSDYTCRMTFSFSLIPFFSPLPGSVKKRLWLKKKKVSDLASITCESQYIERNKCSVL